MPHVVGMLCLAKPAAAAVAVSRCAICLRSTDAIFRAFAHKALTTSGVDNPSRPVDEMETTSSSRTAGSVSDGTRNQDGDPVGTRDVDGVGGSRVDAMDGGEPRAVAAPVPVALGRWSLVTRGYPRSTAWVMSMTVLAIITSRF